MLVYILHNESQGYIAHNIKGHCSFWSSTPTSAFSSFISTFTNDAVSSMYKHDTVQQCIAGITKTRPDWGLITHHSTIDLLETHPELFI